MFFAFTGKAARRFVLSVSFTMATLAAPTAFALVCGDSEPDAGEQCDDGNTTSGDGCSATCLIEAGFTCTPAIAGDPPNPPVPSVCTVDSVGGGPASCDMDGDGDIDRDDIRNISSARGQLVVPGDPGDFDEDGEITRRDVKECTKFLVPVDPT